MAVPRWRDHIPVLASTTVAVAAIILAAVLFAQFVLLKIRISLADDQTAIFDQMREDAADSEPREAAATLRYVVEYYPSGTRQSAGSKLDRIVERARQNAIREIVADLRRTTGRDLGDDPQRWIEALEDEPNVSAAQSHS